jgi:hypothetical protein
VLALDAFSGSTPEPATQKSPDLSESVTEESVTEEPLELEPSATEQPYIVPLLSLGPTEEEVRAFVGPNARYYLNRWKSALEGTGGPRGFHWPAFLIAGLWLPYRKLYKAAFILYGSFLLLTILKSALGHIPGTAELVTGLNVIAGPIVGVIVGMAANQIYWKRARTVIERVRRQSLPEEEHHRELARQGRTSALGSIGLPALGTGAIVGTSLLLQTLWPWDATASVERTVRDGVQRQGVRVRDLRLTPRPDGAYTGTVTDLQGETWDLMRVWLDGNQVKWFLREPLPHLERRFRAEIPKAVRDPVRSCRLERKPDGSCGGRIETENGIVCDIRQSPIGNDVHFPPIFYWVLSPPSYPAWLKVQARTHNNIVLEEVRLEPNGQGVWRGPAADAAGKRYEAIISTRPADLPGAPVGTKLGMEIEWNLIAADE